MIAPEKHLRGPVTPALLHAVATLGQVLEDSGYGEQGFGRLSRDTGRIPPAAALLDAGQEEEGRLATLWSLFHNGKPVDERHAVGALGSELLAALLRENIVVRQETEVRATIVVAAFDDLLIAGDADLEGAGDPEAVEAMSASGVTLSHFTVRRPVASALDLGTGSGFHALMTTRHSKHVTAVDVNPRALLFTRLNQHLNRVDAIETAQGTWTEPVRAKKFDLVMSNPPYVISPDSTYLARDSEFDRDELCRQVVRDGARCLAEGGFATFMCNWIHTGEEWDEPVREWVAELDCDALLFHFRSLDPIGYATLWNRHLEVNKPREYEETVSRWIAHYRQVGIDRMALGTIVLRRRSDSANWVKPMRVERSPNGAGGMQLQHMFEAEDFLRSSSGAQQLRLLLTTPWRLVDHHQLDQTLVHDGRDYATGHAAIRHEPGLGLDAHIDPRVVPLLLEFDGERPLGRLIDESPVPENLDRAAFHSLCLDNLRKLIGLGYVTSGGP